MKIPHFLKIPVPCVLASCVGLFLSTAGAGATVIYADDFSGPAGTDLNDTAPDIRSGTDGGNSAARWIAFNAFDADGTVGNEVQSSCALLPFIPGAGEIYTLSLDVNTTGGGVDWLALGFTQNINTGQAFVGSINGYDWMLLRQDRGLNAGGRFSVPVPMAQRPTLLRRAS